MSKRAQTPVVHVPPARTKAETRAGSFRPGRSSTPLATSTIQGRTCATRAATFSGVRPPARIRRGRGGGVEEVGRDRVPGPAGPAGDVGVDQDGVGRAAQLLGPDRGSATIAATAPASPSRKARTTRNGAEGDEVFGRLVAVELDDPQAEAAARLGDLAGRPVDEQADGLASPRAGRR